MTRRADDMGQIDRKQWDALGNPAGSWEEVGAMAERNMVALGDVTTLNMMGHITNELGGIPCNGHLDFEAGTWTFHRERECSA